MTYTIEVINDHHIVDMTPGSQPRYLPLKFNFTGIHKSIQQVSASFNNLGLAVRDTMRMKRYRTRIADGHHYVTILQPEGGNHDENI